MRPSREAVFAVLYLTAQLAIPLAGVRPARTPVFAPRFSWSMFAGTPSGHCTHRVDYLTRARAPVPLPLPPPSHPAYGLLTARTPGDFARASELLAPYARDDDAIADALGDFLRRYRTTIDPGRTHTLVSTLDCASPLGAPVHRVVRLEAAP